MDFRRLLALACLATLLSGCTAGTQGPPPSNPPDAAPDPTDGPSALAAAAPSVAPTPSPDAPDSTAASRVLLFATPAVLEESKDPSPCGERFRRYRMTDAPSGPLELPDFECGMAFTRLAGSGFRFSGPATVAFQVVCKADYASAEVEAFATLSAGDHVLGMTGRQILLERCVAGNTVAVKLEVATQAWPVSAHTPLALHLSGRWVATGTTSGLSARFEGPVLSGELAAAPALRHLALSQDGTVTGVRAGTTSLGVALDTNAWLFEFPDAIAVQGGTFNVTLEPGSAPVLAARAIWARDVVETDEDFGWLVRKDVVYPGGSFAIPPFKVPGPGTLLVTVQPMNLAGGAAKQPVHLDLRLAYEDAADLSPLATAASLGEAPCPPQCR